MRTMAILEVSWECQIVEFISGVFCDPQDMTGSLISDGEPTMIIPDGSLVLGVTSPYAGRFASCNLLIAHPRLRGVPDGEELPLLLGARRMIARADEGDPGGPVTSIRELADKYGITIRAELADPPRQTWRDRPPLL